MKFVICFFVLVAVAYAQRRPGNNKPAGASSSSLTECQRKNIQAKDKLIVGGLVPECEENGDYAAKQCHPGARFCQCWRRDGTPITQPSTKIKKCSCVRHKDDVQNQKNVAGAFEPECKLDGSYHSKQCWASTGTCWCVDGNGKNLTEPSRATVKC